MRQLKREHELQLGERDRCLVPVGQSVGVGEYACESSRHSKTHIVYFEKPFGGFCTTVKHLLCRRFCLTAEAQSAAISRLIENDKVQMYYLLTHTHAWPFVGRRRSCLVINAGPHARVCWEINYIIRKMRWR